MSILNTNGLVGRQVDYVTRGGQHKHGVVRSATYNLHGDLVLVVHPDPHPCHVEADTVLLGADADALVPQLNQRSAA